MIFHFLNTKLVDPQDAHIDYKWEAFKERNEKMIRPTIIFISLTDDGYVVNVWSRGNKSKINMTNDEQVDEQIYLPYKLIVPKGQIAFLDGEIIHGGGIEPSEKRCHGYLFNPKDFSHKGNTRMDDNEKVIWLYETCKVPYTDYKKLENNWCKEELDEYTNKKKVDEREKIQVKVGNETFKLVTEYHSNKEIENAYKLFRENTNKHVRTQIRKRYEAFVEAVVKNVN